MPSIWRRPWADIEEMPVPDEMDRIQEINEQFQELALEDHLRRRPTGESLTHCEDCGEEIPEARRRAQRGCRTCINCQRDREALLKHWRV